MAFLENERHSRVSQFCYVDKFKAGVQGLEPQQADPESAVLPLHHTPVGNRTKREVTISDDCSQDGAGQRLVRWRSLPPANF